MLCRFLKLAVLNLVLIASSVNAWEVADCLNTCESSMGITESFFESYIGFREDSLKWKVKGKRNNPLIIQELCFNDVKMIEKGLRASVTFCDAWVIKADGNFSFAYNKAHDWAFDLTVGAGYRFDFCDNSIRITPLVGYEINRQHFHSCSENFLSDKCCGANPVTLANLDSFYRAHWNSPFIGVDVHYAINECWKVYSDLAYQFVNLRGKGHTDFGDRNINGFEAHDRFHQRSHNGWGFTWDTGIKYALGCNWLLDIGAQYEFRKSHHGHQHGSHSFKGCRTTCSKNCKGNGRTNNGSSSGDQDKHHVKRVEWRSVRILAGLTYRF